MKIPTLLFVMALAGPASATGGGTVAVMPLRSINVPQYVADVLDSTLAVAVGDVGGDLRVLSANDINAMLGLERMRDAVGCDDVSCAVDIGGALNAEFIVTGSIGKLGNNLTVNLVLVNIAETAVEARVQESARDDEDLYRDAVHAAVRSLFGQRAPPTSDATSSGVETSIAAARAQAAALRDDIPRQRKLLAQLLETAEVPDISQEKKLALFDEFIAAVPATSPVRAEAEIEREKVAIGGPKFGRNVMVGVYGFAGVAISTRDTFIPFGVGVEVGRLRWRNFQVSLARGFVGTGEQVAGDDDGNIPLVFGVSVVGIGGKLHLDSQGKLEVGVLVFPISVVKQDQRQSASPNDDHYNTLGFARTNVYFRYNAESWALELGAELSPVWVGNRPDDGGDGLYGFAGLPATFAYLGISLPTTALFP